MPDRLLILGASVFQLDAIRTAKRLGYDPITTDNLPDSPGRKLVNRAYDIDTTDRSGVLELARKEGVVGVLAPCTDVALPTASYVAKELGLHAPPLATVELLTSKLRFREFQASNGLPIPSYRCVHSEIQDALELKDGLEFPWILKPDRSSGSKGVFVVQNGEEYYQSLPVSRSFSSSGEVVVERFRDGHQGTLEGLHVAGRFHYQFFLDRQTAALPHTATSGHRVPSLLPQPARDRLLEQLADIWTKLQIGDTLFDCDFVWHEEEIYVLELSLRLGGNSIGKLIRSSTGIDLSEIAIRLACGEDIVFPDETVLSPRSVMLFGVEESGVLEYDPSSIDKACELPWVELLTVDREPGDEVHLFQNARHRFGEAVLLAEDVGSLEAREQYIRDLLNFRVVSNSSEG